MNFYSHNSKKIIRLISIIALLILSISTVITIMKFEPSKFVIIGLIQNSMSIMLIIILLLYPEKLQIISFISFQYSLVSLYMSSTDIMGLFLILLGISILSYRGFFKKKKKIKILLISIPFSILYLSELRFGFFEFVTSSVYRFSYIFVLAVSLMFLNKVKIKETNEKEKILDLAQYKGLTYRDKEWLTEIQNGTKYDCLAINYQMSTGAVKNRLRIVFRTLKVGDKLGFMNKYSEYSIIFSI